MISKTCGKGLGVPGLDGPIADSLSNCAISAVFGGGAPGPVDVGDAPAYRLGILKREVTKKGGTLFVKARPLTATWVREEDNIESFQLEQFRIGILKRDGTLWVKEGDLAARWVREEDGVASFQLEGTRIGILKAGVLYVKEGDLSASLVRQEDGIQAFQQKRERIEILRSDGTVMVKEGPSYGQLDSR